MKNASRMARYMMMRGGSNNRENGDMRRDYRPNVRMGYGTEYERENEVRNGYGGNGNEGGNYARDNYGVDNRFRDRRGREHYDNGRFAPVRNEYGNMGGDYSGGYSRGNGTGREYGEENRGGREGEMRRGGVRSEMRGGWDEEEGERMNMIGLERPQEVQNHYPTRIDYMPRNEMERGSSPKMTGGAMGAMGMEHREMDRETAEAWVASMKNEDGSYGGKWRLEQKAMDRNPYEIWAVMNALYCDYGKILRKHGITTPDVFLDMAVAFIDDKDAVKNKPMAYYKYIAKHEYQQKSRGK